MRDQEPNRTRSLFETLACGGMGYCCPYAFFRANKRTGAIATRLGLAERTIRLWKARFRSKELQCCKVATCMKAELIRGGK